MIEYHKPNRFGRENVMVKLIIGIILLILGVFNIRGNISTIHWYNRRRVKESDIPKYGKFVGCGTVIIGGSMILSALFDLAFETAVSDWLLLVGCAVGLAFILFGQFKYNKGIF